jgi:23S rRNA pseudouridine2604 synthase
LNNYISATGICSRREADELIREKKVTVNGVVAELGTQVGENDEVCLNGNKLKAKSQFVTIAYNKPVGITCTSEPDVEGNIIKAIGYPERIFPIGRLDKDSEGLILLTNDGSIVNRILRAENKHDKEYLVNVAKPLDKSFKTAMEKGVKIYNPVKDEMTVTLPCKIKIINSSTFSITLNQGSNRQIRRMCSAIDCKVTALKRIRIMNIHLGSLPKGRWRKLTEDEMKVLVGMLETK